MIPLWIRLVFWIRTISTLPEYHKLEKLRPVHRGETSTHQTALAVNVDWYGSRRIIVGS